MAVTYGFFNSINQDRVYNADQMSLYFEGLISDGVYENVGGAMQVLAGSGMTVNVQTGRAIVDSKWVKNDAVYSITLSPSHVTLDRYTAIVLRLDYANRMISIVAKDGTPASTPVKPAMQNDNTIVELCLAYVFVAHGVTSVTQANITDMRASGLCGWVTGIVEQVDTSQLFLQWQTAYEEFYQSFQDWFDHLTKTLQVNTYIYQYSKRVKLTSGGSKIIPLDMTGYTYEEGDIISVYINGLYAYADVDYYLDDTADPPEVHPNATASGTEVVVTVLKSKVGDPVPSGGGSDISQYEITEGTSSQSTTTAIGEVN